MWWIQVEGVLAGWTFNGNDADPSMRKAYAQWIAKESSEKSDDNSRSKKRKHKRRKSMKDRPKEEQNLAHSSDQDELEWSYSRKDGESEEQKETASHDGAEEKTTITTSDKKKKKKEKKPSKPKLNPSDDDSAFEMNEISHARDDDGPHDLNPVEHHFESLGR